MTCDDRERVRRAIYDAFAAHGRAPYRADIAATVSMSESALDEAMRWLAANRHLALDESGDIVMAHPFSSVNLGFAVMGEKRLWWGGCAWDSFAVPHLVPDESRVLVATSCPSCERALAWRVSRAEPPAGTEVAHFLVPMHDCWKDIVHTCSNQRIFCSGECVQNWLSATRQAAGYVMDLPTLWRLAAGWYAGRLESPYERRDPQSAAQYFRSVGLHGPFWGLDD
jgi:hypothetical protein